MPAKKGVGLALKPVKTLSEGVLKVFLWYYPFTAEGKVKQGKGTHVIINCLFLVLFIVKAFNLTSYVLGEHFRHYCLLK